MGAGDFHNTEKQRPVTIAEWEEHSHLGGNEANPAGKQIQILGLASTRSGMISLASAGFPQKIPATPLTNRKSLLLYNSSASTWWITQASGASGIGIPVLAGEKFGVDSYDDIWVIPIYSGQTLTYLELS